MSHLLPILKYPNLALYPRSLDFSSRESYDSVNVEVREFTFNRCPFQ